MKVFFLLLFCFFAYLTTYLLAFTDSSKLMKVFHHENDFLCLTFHLQDAKDCRNAAVNFFFWKGLSQKFHHCLFTSLKRSHTINYSIINSSSIFLLKVKIFLYYSRILFALAICTNNLYKYKIFPSFLTYSVPHSIFTQFMLYESEQEKNWIK